jgi:hypothetical protein
MKRPSPAPRCSRCFCFAVVLGVLVNALIVDRSAQAYGFFDFRRFAPAIEALHRGDCKTAWDLVWPLAKSGDHHAQLFLSEATLRMAPPGADTESGPIALRHPLIFGMNAALANRLFGSTHSSLRDWPSLLIPIIIEPMSLGASGERVVECYKSSSTYVGCLRLAESLGVVPSFAEYARDIDDTAAKTAASATCRPDSGRR